MPRAAEQFDDGWGIVEDLKPFRGRSNMSSAPSSDHHLERKPGHRLPDRSITRAYRGCEHGFAAICFARPTHSISATRPGSISSARSMWKVNAVACCRELADNWRALVQTDRHGHQHRPYQPAEHRSTN